MSDKPWMKVLRWLGYGLFFLFALLIFVRVTFPTGQVREYLRGQLAERLGADSVTLADVSLVGLFPSGVSLEALEITLPPVKVKTPERGVDVDGGPRVLTIEELTVDGSLTGAMSGEYDFEIDGKIQGGELNGGRVIAEKGGPLKVDIEEMKGIELGSEGLFLSLTGMDVIGTLSGKVSLSVPSVEKDGKSVLAFEQVGTNITLTIDGGTILNPVIDTVMSREPVRMAFTNIDLGTVTLKLASDGAGPATGAEAKGPTKRSVIAIEEVSMSGGDIEVLAAPKATISFMPGQPLKEGTINIHLAVKINEAWFDKEIKDRKDPTKTTKPNSGLRTMMTLGPLKQHVVDGQFGVSITGPLGKPKITPTRPRVRVGSGTSSGGGRKINVDQPGSDGEPEEGDEAPTRPTKSSRTPPSSSPGAGRAEPIVRPALGGGKPASASPMGRPRPNIVSPPDPSELEGTTAPPMPTPMPEPQPEVPTEPQPEVPAEPPTEGDPSAPSDPGAPAPEPEPAPY